MAMAKTAGSTPRSTRTIHHTMASGPSAFGRDEKNFHSLRLSAAVHVMPAPAPVIARLSGQPVVHRHVIAMRSIAQIRGGADTGKRAEVVDEMRLIEVTAPQGDTGPIDVARVVDGGEHSLKPPDPAIQLRRETDLVAKNLDESPRAQADLRRDVGDGTAQVRRRRTASARSGRRDVLPAGRLPAPPAPVRRCRTWPPGSSRRAIDPAPRPHPFPRPHPAARQVVQLARRQIDERKPAARLEGHADHGEWPGGVQQEEFRVRAGDPAVQTIVLVQEDHQRHRSRGKQALLWMRLDVALRVPDQLRHSPDSGGGGMCRCVAMSSEPQPLQPLRTRPASLVKL